MKVNGAAIYATTGSPLLPIPWGRCTQKVVGGNTTLYFSVFDWPKDGKLVINGFKNEVLNATYLADGKSINTAVQNEQVVLQVADKPLDAIATVIKLEVKGTLENQNLIGKKQMKSGALD
jgi:alpha-L-fucosidase